jgi:hypothetical protein
MSVSSFLVAERETMKTYFAKIIRCSITKLGHTVDQIKASLKVQAKFPDRVCKVEGVYCDVDKAQCKLIIVSQFIKGGS